MSKDKEDKENKENKDFIPKIEVPRIKLPKIEVSRIRVGYNINQKMLADIGKIQLQQSESFQKLIKSINQTMANSLLTQVRMINKYPAQQLSQSLNGIALASLKVISSDFNARLKDLSSITAPIEQLQKTIQSTLLNLSTVPTLQPIVEYAEKNKDKIQNFQESSNKVIVQLCELYKITEDEAIDLIDVLIEEGKVITHDDWTVELIYDEVSDKVKSNLTLSDIINLIGIILNLIAMTSSDDIQINIDNSVTNIENQINGDVHYHINEVIEVQNNNLNEYIVVNDTQLYESDDVESKIIAELKSGNRINRFILEDDGNLMLIAIVNENNVVESSGWVKIDDVTLID